MSVMDESMAEACFLDEEIVSNSARFRVILEIIVVWINKELFCTKKREAPHAFHEFWKNYYSNMVEDAFRRSICKKQINIQQLNMGSNMIQNEHQYKISQGKIKEIEQSLDQLCKERKTLHPRQFKMRENGLQGILAEIQEEIEKYDALKEKPAVIEIGSFAEIPVALIKARIASGMTQKDLAEKLGMKEQQIQRYEANQYGSAGFHRLTEVAEALEVTLNSSLLTLRS